MVELEYNSEREDLNYFSPETVDIFKKLPKGEYEIKINIRYNNELKKYYIKEKIYDIPESEE